jgi:2-haloacid dehalogenase
MGAKRATETLSLIAMAVDPPELDPPVIREVSIKPLPAQAAGPEFAVRALLFDVFGTVVDWRSSIIEQLRRFGQDRGFSADWEALADAWRRRYQPSLDRVRQGEIPWTVLDQLHAASFAEAAEELALGPLEPAELEAAAQFWHRLEPWEDVRAGLTRLRRRFIIGPLSNGNLGLMVRLAKSVALPWDVVFGSDLFHHYKPDSEVYLGACHLLRLPPEEVMMVAAHNYDLKAARSLGLRTAFVPRPSEHGPNQQSDLTAEDSWDIVAADFNDLADQL